MENIAPSGITPPRSKSFPGLCFSGSFVECVKGLKKCCGAFGGGVKKGVFFPAAFGGEKRDHLMIVVGRFVHKTWLLCRRRQIFGFQNPPGRTDHYAPGRTGHPLGREFFCALCACRELFLYGVALAPIMRHFTPKKIFGHLR